MDEPRYTTERMTEVTDFPHEFTFTEASYLLTQAATDMVLTWCVEQFGIGGLDDEHRWHSAGYDTVFIRRDEDAFSFKLRWC